MMQALFENLLSYDGKELYCFWEPEIIDEATEKELWQLKVGYRAESISTCWFYFVPPQRALRRLSHARD